MVCDTWSMMANAIWCMIIWYDHNRMVAIRGAIWSWYYYIWHDRTLQKKSDNKANRIPTKHPSILVFRLGLAYATERFRPKLRSTNNTQHLPSLKLTANAPENRVFPKRKRESVPTIHFQGRTVSFREGNYHDSESMNVKLPIRF